MDQNQKSKYEHATNTSVRSSGLTIVNQYVFQALTYGTVYLTGLLNVNPLWLLLPLVLSVMKEHWRSHKEFSYQSAKNASLIKEDQFVVSSIDHLPAWVNFPDVERCEWFNKILAKIWPNISQYFIEVLKTSIEPRVNEKLSSYIKNSFRFSILSLGSIPPRFTGIKVYDKNTSRNEVVMDMNLFYAGDCDISFVILGMTGGFQNIQINGVVRFVMKPLLPFLPLFGGMDMFFVSNPTVDFHTIGVTEFVDFPGLSGKLHQIIKDQIALFAVQPNKYHINFIKDIFSFGSNFLDYEGILSVKVIEASNLVNKDSNINKKDVSDPYAILNVGEQTFKSPKVQNSLNPLWDFLAEFAIESIFDDTVLIVKVLDKDEFTEDSALGFVSIDLEMIKQKQILNSWFQLQETKSGMVHLSLTFHSLTSDRSNYCYDSSNSLSSALLCVYVDSAKDLTIPRNVHIPNAIVQLSIANNLLTSKMVESSCPVFKETFTFLLKNPEEDKLKIKLVDQKNDTPLGQMSLALKQIMNANNMEIIDHSYPLLDSASDSTVILSLRLRVVQKM